MGGKSSFNSFMIHFVAEKLLNFLFIWGMCWKKVLYFCPGSLILFFFFNHSHSMFRIYNKKNIEQQMTYMFHVKFMPSISIRKHFFRLCTSFYLIFHPDPFINDTRDEICNILCPDFDRAEFAYIWTELCVTI